MKCTFTEGVSLILSMDITNLTDNQTVKQWVWYNVYWTQQTRNNKKKRKKSTLMMSSPLSQLGWEKTTNL